MNKDEQREVFESWISEHKALLFKVVRAYAFNADDQDDLFQEITIQIWRSVPKFRHESAVTTWMYRIALNTALKWVSKGKKHIDGRQSVDQIEHVLHESVKPTDERLYWLYEEISRLNEIDRSLALLLLDGFSYKDMAGITGISETNIGVKIHRIKKHLIVKSEKMSHHGV